MARKDPPRDASLPPGYDEEDPYLDRDLSEFPDWWRRNIEEFREHDMRPYRPPRFSDGRFTPAVRADLEREYGVTIQFRSRPPVDRGKWELIVDGELLATVDRRREGEGFTVYDIDSTQFTSLVAARCRARVEEHDPDSKPSG